VPQVLVLMNVVGVVAVVGATGRGELAVAVVRATVVVRVRRDGRGGGRRWQRGLLAHVVLASAESDCATCHRGVMVIAVLC